MLVVHASQLLTLAGGPQPGLALGRLEIIEDGALRIQQGVITAVGPSAELLAAYPTDPILDASSGGAAGCVVLPGFVDPHTHAVWSGDRAAEFELKLQGKSYLEILAAGGGILSTVRATRAASVEQLCLETRPRLQSMLAHGTTTAEVKTGYGLELSAELRQLQAIHQLDAAALAGAPLPALLPTFLGAHAVPEEYRGDADGYTAHLCAEMLPAVQEWRSQQAASSAGALPPMFVDVFCETGAFNLDQSRRILQAARDCGFPLKIHADEFDNLGGAPLAVALGAVSADHLVKTSAADILALGNSRTVAVALPCTPFGLGEDQYTPASALLQAGATLALASDLNPGTAWCGNMQFVIALACRYMRLTPAQAIAAATINAAAALGLAHRIGSIEPGKQADLLILNIPDYRHLGYRFDGNLVQTVIRGGRVFKVNAT